MKKLFTFIVASLVSIGAINAQNFSVEGVAGMNVSNWGDLGSKVGFHVGARAELAMPSLADGIYTNAGLLFSLKGCKQDYGELGSGKTNAYYLEVPIHIGYKYSVTNDLAIFGEVGPYLGVGLFGKSNVEYGDYEDDWGYGYNDYYGEEDESSETFDMADRFDVGVGLRVGVEFKKKYSVSVGYDWGLLDTYKGYGDDDEFTIDLTPSMKHANLTISLGYKF